MGSTSWTGECFKVKIVILIDMSNKFNVTAETVSIIKSYTIETLRYGTI